MDRKVLLIAVVAVVAIGIVAGVLLSGAGRTGSLAGTIVPDQGGCVGSQLEAKYHVGVLKTTVWGTLKNLDGTPIPNQWVYVRQCTTYRCDAFSDAALSVQTDANGRFEVSRSNGGTAPLTLDIEVEYEFGVINGTIACGNTATAERSPTPP